MLLCMLNTDFNKHFVEHALAASRLICFRNFMCAVVYAANGPGTLVLKAAGAPVSGHYLSLLMPCLLGSFQRSSAP